MPENATVNGDGFRIYPWPGGDTDLNRKYNAVEQQDLLSVTSIKTLAGVQFQLVNWQISNVVNLAMGTRKTVRIGPRGGVNEVYVPEGEWPGEFVRRMQATGGGEKEIKELRRWLRSTAEEPRDIAAVRGSVVHKLIEDGLPIELATDREVIEKAMSKQWRQEKRKDPIPFSDDDYNFVSNGLIQYEQMRKDVPFVVLAAEPQVYNLTAGYGGSADVLIWFLGYWVRDADDVVEFHPLPGLDADALQKQASKGLITVEDIDRIGGQVAVGDWKTGKSVYTSHVVQITAYMAGEFIARNGIIDERLTALLDRANLGMVIQIRPDHFEVDLFEMRQDVMRAYFGSVAYARFLALHKTPVDLFVYSMRGQAPNTEGSSYTDDDE